MDPRFVRRIPASRIADAIWENAASATRDPQLIGAAQRVDHHEIAAYGTVRLSGLLSM